MAKKKTNKIEYGNVDLPEDFYKSKGVKERITIMLDEDVVNYFRAEAERLGAKYQTLINMALKSSMEANRNLEARVSKLEREIKKRA